MGGGGGLENQENSFHPVAVAGSRVKKEHILRQLQYSINLHVTPVHISGRRMPSTIIASWPPIKVIDHVKDSAVVTRRDPVFSR